MPINLESITKALQTTVDAVKLLITPDSGGGVNRVFWMI
jgi:hypothetical protein